MTAINSSSLDDIQERLIALTRDLILIPSIPTRPEDRQRCYEFIKNHLESLETIEVREFDKNGIPSLVAAPPNVHNPKILMCGHLDVIAHEDISCYRSVIEDGRIYGPGAGDMKGALAILLEVFRSIHSKHPKASLGIAITSDEETGGEYGIGYLVKEEKLRCSTAMIPDGGSLNQITVEEKGILHVRAQCFGHPGHAARPWLSENPLERLIQGLLRVKQYFEEFQRKEDHWYPTCAITILQTENRTTNRIPLNAMAVMDIRFPPPFTVDKLMSKIKDQLGPKIELECIIEANPTQLSPDEEYKRIIEEVTGQPVELIADDGGSDARYLTPYGIPVLMSRPLVGNLHAQDEWIDIHSMVQFYQIYNQYLTTQLT